jgi:acetyl-CoA C-acetyltransferase
MGVCADLCVLLNITFLEKTKISTQFNRMSVQRKQSNDKCPVAVPQRKGDPIIVSKDEEFTNVKIEKSQP